MWRQVTWSTPAAESTSSTRLTSMTYMHRWQAILATEAEVTVYDQLTSITSDDFQRILGWMFPPEVPWISQAM